MLSVLNHGGSELRLSGSLHPWDQNIQSRLTMAFFEKRRWPHSLEFRPSHVVSKKPLGNGLMVYPKNTTDRIYFWWWLGIGFFHWPYVGHPPWKPPSELGNALGIPPAKSGLTIVHLKSSEKKKKKTRRGFVEIIWNDLKSSNFVGFFQKRHS